MLTTGAAQITPAVICSHPVDVVDLKGRPFTGHKQPSEAVRKIHSVVNTDFQVAAPVVTPYCPTCHTVSTGQLGCENSRVRVVIQNFLEPRLGQHGQSSLMALAIAVRKSTAARKCCGCWLMRVKATVSMMHRSL